MGFNVELASLPLKIRGDVRRCCCVISGGVYENLLFFLAIQLIKGIYPGVQVDVLASARGKQTYELNKNQELDYSYRKLTADSMNLSEGGYNMYHQMVDWLGRPFRSVPRHHVPPLRVSIARKLKEVVAEKYRNAEASLYCMCLLCISKKMDNFQEIVSGFDDSSKKLAALINDSAGVIATNTAAIQLANAREKPSIGLFCSEQKGKLFVPNGEEKKCAIISSKTGKLIDIDVEAVKQAMQIFDMSLALV
ncbi:hypothetical protein CRYUN_Cryun32bG0107600 [Craigia yunnanensis]